MFVIDRAMVGFLIIVFGIGGSWASVQFGIKANTVAIVSNTAYIKDRIATVKLDYVAADRAISGAHSTAFQRLDTEVTNVRRNVSEQAVSIGKIEAGVEYIVSNINGG